LDGDFNSSRRVGGFFISLPVDLFNLRLFVRDVFADHRVKFHDRNFLGLGSLVLGGCVEVTGTGTGFKLDFLAHGFLLNSTS
jgi:hypothetical protein